MPASDTEEDGEQDLVERDPLVRIFGDTAQARILRALLDAHPHGLNPSDIANASGDMARSTVYRNIDELVEAGVVAVVQETAQSKRYGLVGDDVPEALEVVRSWGSVGLYHRDTEYPNDMRGSEIQATIAEAQGGE